MTDALKVALIICGILFVLAEDEIKEFKEPAVQVEVEDE